MLYSNSKTVSDKIFLLTLMFMVTVDWLGESKCVWAFSLPSGVSLRAASLLCLWRASGLSTADTICTSFVRHSGIKKTWRGWTSIFAVQLHPANIYLLSRICLLIQRLVLLLDRWQISLKFPMSMMMIPVEVQFWHSTGHWRNFSPPDELRPKGMEYEAFRMALVESLGLEVWSVPSHSCQYPAIAEKKVLHRRDGVRAGICPSIIPPFQVTFLFLNIWSFHLCRETRCIAFTEDLPCKCNCILLYFALGADESIMHFVVKVIDF